MSNIPSIFYFDAICDRIWSNVDPQDRRALRLVCRRFQEFTSDQAKNEAIATFVHFKKWLAQENNKKECKEISAYIDKVIAEEDALTGLPQLQMSMTLKALKIRHCVMNSTIKLYPSDDFAKNPLLTKSFDLYYKKIERYCKEIKTIQKQPNNTIKAITDSFINIGCTTAILDTRILATSQIPNALRYILKSPQRISRLQWENIFHFLFSLKEETQSIPLLEFICNNNDILPKEYIPSIIHHVKHMESEDKITIFLVLIRYYHLSQESILELLQIAESLGEKDRFAIKVALLTSDQKEEVPINRVDLINDLLTCKINTESEDDAARILISVAKIANQLPEERRLQLIKEFQAFETAEEIIASLCYLFIQKEISESFSSSLFQKVKDFREKNIAPMFCKMLTSARLAIKDLRMIRERVSTFKDRAYKKEIFCALARVAREEEILAVFEDAKKMEESLASKILQALCENPELTAEQYLKIFNHAQDVFSETKNKNRVFEALRICDLPKEQLPAIFDYVIQQIHNHRCSSCFPILLFSKSRINALYAWVKEKKNPIIENFFFLILRTYGIKQEYTPIYIKFLFDQNRFAEARGFINNNLVSTDVLIKSLEGIVLSDLNYKTIESVVRLAENHPEFSRIKTRILKCIVSLLIWDTDALKPEDFLKLLNTFFVDEPLSSNLKFSISKILAKMPTILADKESRRPFTKMLTLDDPHIEKVVSILADHSRPKMTKKLLFKYRKFLSLETRAKLLKRLAAEIPLNERHFNNIIKLLKYHPEYIEEVLDAYKEMEKDSSSTM